MENLLQTITYSFIIVVIALALLGIGWLITGRSKIKGGTCGRDPTQKGNSDCESNKSHCQLCNPNEDGIKKKEIKKNSDIQKDNK